MRNPELRRIFGKSLRGGLLLYGPPGCGKTFLARAVAGEMGARFISMSIADVLDMYVGRAERNLHDLFQTARAQRAVRAVPRRDRRDRPEAQPPAHSPRCATVVNQLLAELDGVDGDNEGVFVLAATNAPWDVDAALRRPGRLDRTVLVLPPDQAGARGDPATTTCATARSPAIDLAHGRRAPPSDYSGADLAHVCETAAECAMRDSIASRRGPDDRAGRPAEPPPARCGPSTGAWFATARNVAMFANEGGEYDDLAAYLRKRRP